MAPPCVRLDLVRKGYGVALGFAGWLALGGGALLLLLWAMQERMTFHPSPIIEATPATFRLTHEDVRIQAPDGPVLAGWWVPGQGSSPVILFLHGNAGNVSHRLFQVRQLHEAGLGLLLLDYRGYGESTGTPTEAGLRIDARAAWDHLTGRLGVPPGRVLLYGESIGSTPALGLALELQGGGAAPAGIILEGAFTSALDMARRAFPFLPMSWILRLKMDNLEAVRRVKLPILFLHGTKDEIVPFTMGRSLYEASASPSKDFFEIPGAMHNSVWTTARDAVRERVRDFALAATGTPRGLTPPDSSEGQNGIVP